MSWAISVPFAALLVLERADHLRAREVFEWLCTHDVLRWDSGVLYGALRSLEQAGLIERVPMRRATFWRGRTAKHFRITNLGRSTIALALRGIRELRGEPGSPLQDGERSAADVMLGRPRPPVRHRPPSSSTT